MNNYDKQNRTVFGDEFGDLETYQVSRELDTEVTVGTGVPTPRLVMALQGTLPPSAAIQHQIDLINAELLEVKKEIKSGVILAEALQCDLDDLLRLEEN